MSTRSNICLLNKETKTISKIYCHHDGYIEYVGKILNKHYTDSKKIKELLELGDISILGKNVYSKKTLENNKDTTMAYIRDCGEPKEFNESVTLKFNEFADFLKNAGGIEYVYLYIDDIKKWVFWETYETNNENNENLVKLMHNLNEELKEKKNE